ncbi:unnamed protein product [Auanema sp. JU1783]|nr:unnamed protein product [Auanema sp. JU1783]
MFEQGNALIIRRDKSSASLSTSPILLVCNLFMIVASCCLDPHWFPQVLGSQCRRVLLSRHTSSMQLGCSGSYDLRGVRHRLLHRDSYRVHLFLITYETILVNE